MRGLIHTLITGAVAGAVSTIAPHAARAQQPGPRPDHSVPASGSGRAASVRVDSMAVVAGERYEAGGFVRWLAGDGYRDLWTTRIHVPVLDIHTFKGGLEPVKEGGGNQEHTSELQ